MFIIGDFMVSPIFKTPSTSLSEKREISSFSSDEQSCYLSIVKTFLNQKPVPRSTLEKFQPRVYALIFRQTESWESVEQMFRTIIASKFKEIETDQKRKIDKWALAWITSIRQLRATYAQTKDPNPLIQKEAKKSIKNQLLNLFKRLEKDLKEDALNPQCCKDLLNFLVAHKVHLSVFADSSISLDERKLFVEIRLAKQKIKKNYSGINVLVNTSTKAIFLIKETFTEEPFKHYKDMISVTTTKIDVEYSSFAPPTPSVTKPRSLKEKSVSTEPPPLKRRPSFVKLPDEFFFDFQLDEDYKSEKEHKMKENAIKKIESMKTGMAARLEAVVNRAIKDVNEKLNATTSSTSTDSDDENPEGSTSRSIFYFVPSFFSLFS